VEERNLSTDGAVALIGLDLFGGLHLEMDCPAMTASDMSYHESPPFLEQGGDDLRRASGVR
jgi:hypothetical protein